MRGAGVQRLSFPRGILSAVVVADLLSFFFFLSDARAIAVANGIALNAFNDLVSRTVVRGAIVLLGVAGAVAFVRRPGRLWPGMLALAALLLLSTAHAQLFGSPWRHLFYSGLCLSGWLLGLAVSRHQGVPTDESYARAGSMALLGAAYMNAGISKLVYGGVDWVSGAPIQAVIIGQDGMVTGGIVSAYRSWVVATPAVASLFSVATLAFELFAPLMLLGRRTRICIALGLLAMHTNIYVLTRILYWESMVFLVLFGLFSGGPDPEALPESAASVGSCNRTFVGGATLLAVCALLAILHQGWRSAHPRAPKAVTSVPPAPPGADKPLAVTGTGEPSTPTTPALR